VAAVKSRSEVQVKMQMTVERARGTSQQRQDGQGRVVETDGGRNEKTREENSFGD